MMIRHHADKANTINENETQKFSIVRRLQAYTANKTDI